MKIGVDAREIQRGVTTGIGRALANFISWFTAHHPQHELVLFAATHPPAALVANTTVVVLKPGPTWIWDQYKLPRALARHQIDLFYSPYYKLPLLSRVPMLNQVLDLMYLLFPPYRRELSRFAKCYYALFGRACCAKAISVITDSQHAKGDIIRHWQVPSAKITVIPLGAADRYQPVTDPQCLAQVRQAFGLPERFVLYLGNFKPHKNVAVLVDAFASLASKFPDHKLVLAGPLDQHSRDLQTAVTRQQLHDRVIFTDTIREADCPEALLTLAELFVFPTLYEGFGLPALEAMACGTAVIASDRTSVPEVVGDAGILVDPTDPAALATAMAAVLADPARRAELGANGLRRAAQLRQDATAGRLCEHLLTVLASCQRRALDQQPQSSQQLR